MDIMKEILKYVKALIGFLNSILATLGMEMEITLPFGL
jgi:hypothetical protein